jgi:plasmid maintenance system antidote protein VapI
MPKRQVKPNGRPPHAPTDALRMQVGLMAAAGIPRYAIANMMGIHVDTLTKHYEDDLVNGVHKMTSQIAIRLYKKALSNEPDARAAGEFLLRHRAGWTDKKSFEVTGADGKPLIPTQEIDVSNLSKDARNALKFALMAAKDATQAIDDSSEIVTVEAEEEQADDQTKGDTND